MHNIKSQSYLHVVFLLEAFPSPKKTAVVEHVVAVGVESPVGALPWLLVVPRDFDKTLVERQVVPDRVLPALEGRKISISG